VWHCTTPEEFQGEGIYDDSKRTNLADIVPDLRFPLSSSPSIATAAVRKSGVWGQTDETVQEHAAKSAQVASPFFEGPFPRQDGAAMHMFVTCSDGPWGTSSLGRETSN
jgi:hypothetical protein